MSRRWWRALACAVLPALAGCDGGCNRASNPPAHPAEPAAPAPEGPLPGFDYKSFVRDHLALIGAGKAPQAALHLAALAATPDTFSPTWVEDASHRFADLAAAAGRYNGHDLAGYKALTPRVRRIYAVAYFDRRPYLAEYGFTRQPSGEWKLDGFALRESLDELAHATPLVPLKPE
jgi:hypothetical protein